ncbi:GDP-6-deoxy-D-mannose reductase [Sulfurimicrobium lacus]|uniref:GDP-6-deoxy-D-mannose reductase n=1 Tax=Sulfurimicrobium lacus TaxID=2715678 RepID=A0A6F8VHT7_9PROT|nr:GDP-6-deoxy-D-mannose reductase [Sulfurimicrobium lacus]
MAKDNSYGLELLPPQSMELRDAESVAIACKESKPDFVIHLAAQSFVPESFNNPRETYEINFFGTLHLLQGLKKNGFKGRLLYVGSGDMYGLVAPEILPVTENIPLKPRNPYAVSKVAAEALCYQWSQTEGMDIVMVRPFNHIGPGQSERFAVSDFARQVVEIKLGRREAEITVGDIDVTRDFTDVRDVVRAYLLLLSEGKSGEAYNVCSGKEISIREILEQLMVLAGVQASIRQDGSRFRPAEQRRVYGSCDKICGASGWQPEIPLEQALMDNLNYWEGKLKHG